MNSLIGTLRYMNRSADKKYVAKVYDQGQDWKVLITMKEIPITERWFSRYEPIEENRERVFDFVQDFFKEHGTESEPWIFL